MDATDRISLFGFPGWRRSPVVIFILMDWACPQLWRLKMEPRGRHHRSEISDLVCLQIKGGCLVPIPTARYQDLHCSASSNAYAITNDFSLHKMVRMLPRSSLWPLPPFASKTQLSGFSVCGRKVFSRKLRHHQLQVKTT